MNKEDIRKILLSIQTTENQNQVNKLLENKFLQEMNFKTNLYNKKELQNENFIAEHPEAQLAIHIFGKNSNVGTAKISLDMVNSKEWQLKKKKKIEEFEKMGITLNKESKER